MVTRVVIAEFHPHVTAAQVAQFQSWLEEAARKAQGLVRMTCGEHVPAVSDPVLSSRAPDAVFGSFMSIWEFESEQALNEFLVQPFHREMAATKFPTVVQRRYVANIR
jgi:hypothetical protein